MPLPKVHAPPADPQPATRAGLDRVAGDLTVPTFTPAFPDASMVSAAAGLVHPLSPWDGAEGPRYRLVIAPGVIAVRSRDLARRERSANRAAENRVAGEFGTNSDAMARGGYAGLFDAADGLDVAPVGRRGVVTGWSRRSRSRMTERLGELDYSPLYDGEGLPAMLTLTYPDDWRSVVPDPGTLKRHMLAYRKRFERAWGRPLVAVWKMEFQRRGAPHLHLQMLPPTGSVDGRSFREWNAHAWVEIVGATGEDRDRHLSVHLGPRVVDYAEGMRSADPRRLAVYFAKHGAYAAKEYQNQAPAEWLHRPGCPDHGVRWRVLGVCSGCRSVGRFWGYWHLSPARAEVEVTPAEADAARRTLRRYARANAGGRVETFTAPDGRPARRFVAVTGYREYAASNTARGHGLGRGLAVDACTGQVQPARGRKAYRWRPPSALLAQRGGFLLVNSGPRMVEALSKYLDQVGGRDVRSVYGHQIGAARNRERPPAMTARGRGLLTRARYLAAEPLPRGLPAASEHQPDLCPGQAPGLFGLPDERAAFFLERANRVAKVVVPVGPHLVFGVG